ncbi:MAG: DUF4143 domain-containing protein, partial [Actinomycetales bacterium]
MRRSIESAATGAAIGTSGMWFSYQHPHTGRYTAANRVRREIPRRILLGKRLTRMPKVHLRDTGLLHALLGIGSMHELLGHPVAGPSF